MKGPFFKVCPGRTRWVFLIGCYAFKFPSFKSWYWFLRGLMDNMFEAGVKDIKVDALAPIVFSVRGGWLNVMVRVEGFTQYDDKHPALLKYLYALADAHEKDDKAAFNTLEVIEAGVPENFGIYQGRVVALDYGNDKNGSLNVWIIKEMKEDNPLT